MRYILATINTSHVTANSWMLARETACTPRNSMLVFSLFGTTSHIISSYTVINSYLISVKETRIYKVNFKIEINFN